MKWELNRPSAVDRYLARFPKKSTNHEITTDGITVWINGHDGLLGRFGLRGIDIHNAPAETILTGNECLLCTHAETTRDDWLLFVYKMNELHGVQIDLAYTPNRFR